MTAITTTGVLLAAVFLMISIGVGEYRANELTPRSAPVHRPYRLLASAWLAAMIVPLFRTNPRDPNLAGEGIASAANYLELALYALLLITALPHLRTQRGKISPGLVALAIFAGLSAVWSQAPLLTLARASQLGVLALTSAALAICIIGDSRSFWRSLGTASLALTGLSIIALAADVDLDGRVTWWYVHPGAVANTAGLLLVVIWFAPPLALPYWLRTVVAGSMGAMVIATGARTATVVVLVAIAFGYFLRNRHRVLTRAYLVPLGVGAALAILILLRSSTGAFIYRNGLGERLGELDGRIPLWAGLVADLNAAGQIGWGVGYGASRTLTLSLAQWAGGAHNSALEWLSSLGVVGLAIVVGIAGATAIRSPRALRSRPGDVLPLLTGLTFALGVSLVGETLALPGIALGFAFLTVTLLRALAQRTDPATAGGRHNALLPSDHPTVRQ